MVITKEVVGRLLTPSARQAALACTGSSPEAIGVFDAQAAAGLLLLQLEGVGPTWAALVADWHRDVWFSVGNIARKV